MADLALNTVTATQGATLAIKDGTVAPRRYTFEFEEVPALVQAFRRMVRGLEFDVCEMAFTTYLCAKAFGKPFTALPIFLVRAFHHGAIVRSTAAAALSPKDLEGRKAGVNRGYTVTTGVWARGILQDEYGVDLRRVTWVLSGDEHVAEYRPPANVVPAEQGQDLTALVIAGELAAGIGLAADQPGLEPLIPGAEEAGFEALRRSGLYPINHLIVVRNDLLDAHPDLAADVFGAFAEAKNRYVERLRRDDIENPTPTDRMYRRVMAITGADPLPYGIAPNRAMIDQLIRHAVSQQILDRPPDVEMLFPQSTHNLTALPASTGDCKCSMWGLAVMVALVLEPA
jgi:4,5-dihydroxyphthalate decarboxylase